MGEQNQLSRRERQIMDIVYALSEASATRVLSDMDDPPSRESVRTLLRILEQKGHLSHYKKGREFIYRPIHPRRLAGQSAMRRVLSTFFDGSLERAVAAHLSDDAADLSKEELDRLVEQIREAGRKEK